MDKKYENNTQFDKCLNFPLDDFFLLTVLLTVILHVCYSSIQQSTFEKIVEYLQLTIVFIIDYHFVYRISENSETFPIIIS